MSNKTTKVIAIILAAALVITTAACFGFGTVLNN